MVAVLWDHAGDRDGWPMAPIVVVVVVLGAVVAVAVIGGDARAVIVVLTMTPRMTMVVVLPGAIEPRMLTVTSRNR